MSTKVNVWMPLYVQDFLTGTMDMSYEEKGVYIHILCAYWDRKGPLGDEKNLREFTQLSQHRWKRVREKVLKKFSLENGVYHHERLDREIAQALEKREKCAKGGRRKAEKLQAEKPLLQQAPSRRSAPTKTLVRASEGEGEGPVREDLSTEGGTGRRLKIVDGGEF